jgi:hypothetical protein
MTSPHPWKEVQGGRIGHSTSRTPLICPPLYRNPPRFCPHSVKEFISTEGSSKFCYLTFVCLRDLYQLSVFKNSSCRAGERRTTSSFEAVASMGSGSNLVCVCRLPSGPQKNYPRFDTRPLGGVGAW